MDRKPTCCKQDVISTYYKGLSIKDVNSQGGSLDADHGTFWCKKISEIYVMSTRPVRTFYGQGRGGQFFAILRISFKDDP